jgi:hypothetical protein
MATWAAYITSSGAETTRGRPSNYAPDGSMMMWHNAMEQNRRVDIESIEFSLIA